MQRPMPAIGCLIMLVLLTGGCATQTARTQLEEVAKDWCYAIRASQVIPVYPLTEDLQPGDVFLVQATQGSQERIWKNRGFLPLDDFRTRLRIDSFDGVYFDSYWKDSYGAGAHPRPTRTAGVVSATDPRVIDLSQATAPRAAFPSYSVSVRSGSGFSLALPVKGVPVGLDFLNAQSVDATITIGDARTYTADPGLLYSELEAWASEDSVRRHLSNAVSMAGSGAVYLRVVSRVYMTGGVLVSLSNADSTGVGARAGAAPKLELVKADGSVDENYKAVLDNLNERSNTDFAKDPAGKVIPGAAVRFVAASSRSVTMAEKFDTLLAIGYLGFDVPVYRGGVLGSPIPTFQRLEGVAANPPQRVATLSPAQQRFKVSEAAFESLAESNPKRALAVADSTMTALNDPDFRSARQRHDEAAKALGTPAADEALEAFFAEYKIAALTYVTRGGDGGPRYEWFDEAFASAYYKQKVGN